MSDREQLTQVCRWNHTLACENRRLRQQNADLRRANAKQGVEHAATLVFLDAAWEAAEGAQGL